MKLRGAISGFGQVAAQAHLPGWCTRESISIVVVHEPVAERRNEAFRLIKNVRVYDDLDLMIDGEAPDFVDIASPPAAHAATAHTALAAGSHVLVEKPLCLTIEEFDELTALARKRQRILMCVHNWKHAPAYVLAKKLIDQGRIGVPRFISLDRLRVAPAGAQGAGQTWRATAQSGGGILIDHGWHVFYLMQWLFGGARPVSVSAVLSTPDAGRAEDVADLRVAFDSGRLARAHLSWRAPVRRTSALIFGDAGMLEIEGNRVIFTDRTGHPEDLSVADIADDSYHSAWFAGIAQDFERAIADGCGSDPATINLTETRAAIGLIAAARESASEAGAAVSLI